MKYRIFQYDNNFQNNNGFTFKDLSFAFRIINKRNFGFYGNSTQELIHYRAKQII